MKVLFIDNYDSFASTLAAYVQQAGADVTMMKSDASLNAIHALQKDLIILGPGPNGPEEAGNYTDVIAAYHRKTPLFGVCLGFQTLVTFFGGTIHPLNEPAHGIEAKVTHTGEGLFAGIENPASFGRYHSLGLYTHECPPELEVTASSADMVMGVQHRHYPLAGVQFHPESVLSANHGKKLIENIITSYLPIASR